MTLWPFGHMACRGTMAWRGTMALHYGVALWRGTMAWRSVAMAIRATGRSTNRGEASTGCTLTERVLCQSSPKESPKDSSLVMSEREYT